MAFYSNIMLHHRHSPIIVEHLRKHAWMTVEEVLVQYGIVVGQRLRQLRKAGGWDFLECRFVRFVSDAAYVEDDPILRVHVHIHG